MLTSHRSRWVRIFGAIPPLLLLSGIGTIFYAFQYGRYELLQASISLNGELYSLTAFGKLVVVLSALSVLFSCVPLLLAFHRTVFGSPGRVDNTWLRDHQGEAAVFKAVWAIRHLTSDYYAAKARIDASNPPVIESNSYASPSPPQTSAAAPGGIRALVPTSQVPPELRGQLGSVTHGGGHGTEDSDEEEDVDGVGAGRPQLQVSNEARDTDAVDVTATSPAAAQFAPSQDMLLHECTSIPQLNALYASRVSAARSGLPPTTSLGHTQPVVDSVLSGSWQPGPHGMRWCAKCAALKPPRAHHCSMCGICVLRMDHHCPWVGNCVGFGNYHSFVLILGWGLVATLLVTVSWAPVLFGWWQPLQPSSGAGVGASGGVGRLLSEDALDVLQQLNRGGGKPSGRRVLEALSTAAALVGRAAAAVGASRQASAAAGDTSGEPSFPLPRAVPATQTLGADRSLAAVNEPFTFLAGDTPTVLGFALSGTFCITLSLFLAMHLWLIAKGKTTLEHSLGSGPRDPPHAYDYGAARNFALVFGPGPSLTWLWPRSGPHPAAEEATRGGTDYRAPPPSLLLGGGGSGGGGGAPSSVPRFRVGAMALRLPRPAAGSSRGRASSGSGSGSGGGLSAVLGFGRSRFARLSTAPAGPRSPVPPGSARTAITEATVETDDGAPLSYRDDEGGVNDGGDDGGDGDEDWLREGARSGGAKGGGSAFSGLQCSPGSSPQLSPARHPEPAAGGALPWTGKRIGFAGAPHGVPTQRPNR